jgi:DNA polymerase III delta' subunit
MVIGHKKQWEFLKKKFELDQLSHAYLFSGAKEIGKKTFAVEFVKLLNCLATPKLEAKAGLAEKKPCGKCVNCQMIEKNSFPDFKIITKKEDKSEIDISQIREVQNFLSYKSYYGSFKIVAVDDAEKMNQEAQSCFLKTLEEPKGKTLLILITSKLDMLLPTIASRCQTLKFFRPKELPLNPERLKKEQEILKDFLPIIDSSLAEKFKYSKSIDFEQQDIGDILEVMQKYFRNSLLEKVGVGKINNPTPRSPSATGVAAEGLAIQKIKNIVNLIDDISNKLLFTNANPKLALEILLMEI